MPPASPRNCIILETLLISFTSVSDLPILTSKKTLLLSVLKVFMFSMSIKLKYFVTYPSENSYTRPVVSKKLCVYKINLDVSVICGYKISGCVATMTDSTGLSILS